MTLKHRIMTTHVINKTKYHMQSYVVHTRTLPSEIVRTVLVSAIKITADFDPRYLGEKKRYGIFKNTVGKIMKFHV